MMTVIRSIDAHIGGAAVRLLVDGVPRPGGKTMAQKRGWMIRHADPLRRSVMLEPRGHADLVGALLTEAETPLADAGLIFMDAAGFPQLSGTAVIAAATIAVERRLVESPDLTRLTFDTPAGTVRAGVRLQIAGDRRRADTVTLTGVPSFVIGAGQPLRIAARDLRVDVAFGGVSYAIVDTEAIGIPLNAATLPDLRRLAAQIVEAAAGVPAPPPAGAVSGVVFTGPPHDPEAHLRSVTVTGPRVDRSPSATGTSAVMAVLDAMGLLDPSQAFVHESLTGTLLRGRIGQRTQVGEIQAIVPEIEGAAWITGEHTFLIDEDDPLRDGWL